MRFRTVLTISLAISLSILTYGKDKSGTYQLGTFVAASAVDDGTTTNNISCGDRTFGSTVCSGGVKVNQVTIYRIQAADGFWSVETMRQADDALYRQMFNDNNLHLHAEKENPLDLLKNGDRVLFRVERHKKLIGETDLVYIPFANNPDKEAKFVGTFTPTAIPAQPLPPSDNVKAMCDAHKLSPEMEKAMCGPAPSAGVSSTPADAGNQQQLVKNSQAAMSSPAQAAAIAEVGHAPSQQELAVLVQKGEASRCAVVTSPPGAEISIDGNRAGVSPMAFVLIRKGDTPRVVTIKMPGYKTIEKDFVPDGKTIPIGLTLEKDSDAGVSSRAAQN